MINTNEKLYFYKVNVDYINYLRKFESKVPFIEYPKHDKFFIGTIFNINNKKYFAPISSYNKQNKTTFNIYDGENIISSVRLNFMFPVIDGVYTQINFAKDFEKKYAILVQKEYEYCNKHKEEIFKIAKYVYNTRTKNKNGFNSEFFKQLTCNFELLEIKSTQYKKSK